MLPEIYIFFIEKDVLQKKMCFFAKKEPVSGPFLMCNVQCAVCD